LIDLSSVETVTVGIELATLFSLLNLPSF